ncbi:hypothetical protein MNBD_ALPHA12-834, partial [hydrothermal vent metagenome]
MSQFVCITGAREPRNTVFLSRADGLVFCLAP